MTFSPSTVSHRCSLQLSRWLRYRRESLTARLAIIHSNSTHSRQSLPRVDALTSRQFLQHLLPALCTVPSSTRPLSLPPSSSPPAKRIRALDVGAGVGRVTSDVLLHLAHDVVLLEPVAPFVHEAARRARASAAGTLATDAGHAPWKGLADSTRSVTLLQGTLQAFVPARPLEGATLLDRVGYAPPQSDAHGDDETESKFDVVWCQWCLGHLSDADLVSFFRRCRDALRDPQESVVVVKENLCKDGEGGEAPRMVFDESDSSLTRCVVFVLVLG